MAGLTGAKAWLYALKPGSWPKLGAPYLLGQALGMAHSGGFRWEGAVVGAGITLGFLGTIVLLNDWGDRQIDELKRRMFPDGCSPKTIPDGILPASAVLAAGVASAALMVGSAFVGSAWLGLPALGWLGLLTALIFQAYTFPPVRLNYRGGGELLEAFGIGLLVPYLNAYIQAGTLTFWGQSLLLGHVLLSLASALASGLSDEVSDRAGGKNTFTTWLGNDAVRWLVDGLMPAAAVCWLVAGFGVGSGLTIVPAAFWVFHFGERARRRSFRAVTNAFDAQRAYKNELHRAIWWGTTILACTVAWWSR